MNHSVKKTSISRLLDADVLENYVMQLSGHKNIESLSSYKTPSSAHQRKMSMIVNRGLSVKTTEHREESALQKPSRSTVAYHRQDWSSETNFRAVEMPVFPNSKPLFAGANTTNCAFNMFPRGETGSSSSDRKKHHRIISSCEKEDFLLLDFLIVA